MLLAEDDRAIRNALERALTLEGYRVTAVADGVEALEQAHRGRPDVLVLDVMMPGLDGLQVCRELRAEGDATPILMLTALVETADRIAGLDAGADDYVVKPFDVEEVFARLRALLRRTAQAPAQAQAPAPASGSAPAPPPPPPPPRPVPVPGPRRHPPVGAGRPRSSRRGASWRPPVCGWTRAPAGPGGAGANWS